MLAPKRKDDLGEDISLNLVSRTWQEMKPPHLRSLAINRRQTNLRLVGNGSMTTTAQCRFYISYVNDDSNL